MPTTQEDPEPTTLELRTAQLTKCYANFLDLNKSLSEATAMVIRQRTIALAEHKSTMQDLLATRSDLLGHVHEGDLMDATDTKMLRDVTDLISEEMFMFARWEKGTLEVFRQFKKDIDEVRGFMKGIVKMAEDEGVVLVPGEKDGSAGSEVVNLNGECVADWVSAYEEVYRGVASMSVCEAGKLVRPESF